MKILPAIITIALCASIIVVAIYSPTSAAVIFVTLAAIGALAKSSYRKGLRKFIKDLLTGW